MKKKFKSAKHAHEARVLAAKWEELLKAHQSKTYRQTTGQHKSTKNVVHLSERPQNILQHG